MILLPFCACYVVGSFIAVCFVVVHNLIYLSLFYSFSAYLSVCAPLLKLVRVFVHTSCFYLIVLCDTRTRGGVLRSLLSLSSVRVSCVCMYHLFVVYVTVAYFGSSLSVLNVF
jgi:hypothetical protein